MQTQKLDFNEYFYYDETSPSCLRWKVDRLSGKNYRQCHVHAGDVAGSVNAEGYWQLKLNHNNLQVHRIIVEMHGIDCKGLQVDHRNRNTLDNKISNLRVVNKSTNLRNKGMYSNNKTGVVGVQFKSRIIAGNTYDSYIGAFKQFDGTQKQKEFSCHKYGYEQAFRLACEWRTKMIEQLNAEGAGYTDSHGK